MLESGKITHSLAGETYIIDDLCNFDGCLIQPTNRNEIVNVALCVFWAQLGRDERERERGHVTRWLKLTYT